jgi:hypothetical protein
MFLTLSACGAHRLLGVLQATVIHGYLVVICGYKLDTYVTL